MGEGFPHLNRSRLREKDQETTEMPCPLGVHRLRAGISQWTNFRIIKHTNEEYQSLCRCWLIRNLKLAHSPDYGAHEVDVEDGIDIN
jgi:hypothetical protein